MYLSSGQHTRPRSTHPINGRRHRLQPRREKGV